MYVCLYHIFPKVSSSPFGLAVLLRGRARVAEVACCTVFVRVRACSTSWFAKFRSPSRLRGVLSCYGCFRLATTFTVQVRLRHCTGHVPFRPRASDWRGSVRSIVLWCCIVHHSSLERHALDLQR